MERTVLISLVLLGGCHSANDTNTTEGDDPGLQPPCADVPLHGNFGNVIFGEGPSQLPSCDVEPFFDWGLFHVMDDAFLHNSPSIHFNNLESEHVAAVQETPMTVPEGSSEQSPKLPDSGLPETALPVDPPIQLPSYAKDFAFSSLDQMPTDFRNLERFISLSNSHSCSSETAPANIFSQFEYIGAQEHFLQSDSSEVFPDCGKSLDLSLFHASSSSPKAPISPGSTNPMNRQVNEDIGSAGSDRQTNLPSHQHDLIDMAVSSRDNAARDSSRGESLRSESLLIVPDKYDDLVTFCQNIDIHHFFNSLGISKSELIKWNIPISSESACIRMGHHTIDISEMHFMYVADTAADILVFAVNAYLKLSRIEACFYPSHFLTSITSDLNPAIQCLTSHCDGDLRIFIEKWGDPFRIHQFSIFCCLPSHPCTVLTASTAPIFSALFTNDERKIAWMKAAELHHKGFHEKLHVVTALTNRLGNVPYKLLERNLYNLVRNGRAILHCLHRHHQGDVNAFQITWRNSLPLTKFISSCCQGQNLLGLDQCGGSKTISKHSI